MMFKTRIFIAKSMAKKSYKDAMDAMKTLKSKIKKPKGIKEKTMAGIKKVKSGATIPAVGFGLGAAGGFGTAGAVTYLMGYNKGKKDKNKKKG